MTEKMAEETILQLRIAFDNLPQKGLFFWWSLLLPKEVDYEEFVKKTFDGLFHNVSPEKSDVLAHYQQVSKNLICLRHLVLTNPTIKTQIEQIRDMILEKTVHEVMMDQMKEEVLTIKKQMTTMATHLKFLSSK